MAQPYILCVQAAIFITTTVGIGPLYEWLWDGILMEDVSTLLVDSSKSLRQSGLFKLHEIIFCTATFSGPKSNLQCSLVLCTWLPVAAAHVSMNDASHMPA